MARDFPIKRTISVYENYKLQNSSYLSSSESSRNDITIDIPLNLNKPKTKRVLIVDDEKLVRGTFKRYYKKLESDTGHQYEVFEADNALTALNLIHDDFMKKNIFDILIIDECMPFMKGSSLVKLLTTLHMEGNFNKMLVISHTSFDTTELKNSILDSGADYIWNKPIQYEEFKQFFLSI